MNCELGRASTDIGAQNPKAIRPEETRESHARAAGHAPLPSHTTSRLVPDTPTEPGARRGVVGWTLRLRLSCLLLAGLLLCAGCRENGDVYPYHYNPRSQRPSAGEPGSDTSNAPGCQPNCEGRECGSDGCVGNCGSCYDLQGAVAPELCLESGLCCKPDCLGRICGPDKRAQSLFW